MTFDAKTQRELRSHHADSMRVITFETWLNALIDMFETSFPELPVQRFPDTFLVWVRANANAVRTMQTMPVTVH